MRFPRISPRLSLASLGLTVLLAVPAQAQSYALTDLGALAVPSTMVVNNQGQVAGDIYVTRLSAYHAFLSAPSGGPLHDLGTFGGANSFAYGVNNKGQVTGSAYPNPPGSHAFLSDANGGSLHDLGTLGGDYSAGYGVNDSGQVAGVSTTAGGAYHAFFLDTNGGVMRDLGTLGGASSAAYGINATGQVTGELDNDAFLSDANGGPLHDLGTLGGGGGSRGTGVNSAGQVTGYAATADPTAGFHAFLSDANGGPLHDLGTLGGTSSSGDSVNGRGQVVGSSATGTSVDSSGAQHAFLFSGGRMLDLNGLISPLSGFVLTGATGISDTGFIVASGVNAAGRRDTFLLTPVPEAGTRVSFGLLFALAVAVIAARRGVKREQASAED